MAVTHDAILKRSILGRWLHKILRSFCPGLHASAPREMPTSRHPQDEFWTTITPHIR
jgi:hypothetical protein